MPTLTTPAQFASKRATGNRGTIVRVNIQYNPPAGVIGATVAKLFGEEPQQQLDDDLRRFKQVMEVGEVVVSDATLLGHRLHGPATRTAGRSQKNLSEARVAAEPDRNQLPRRSRKEAVLMRANCWYGKTTMRVEEVPDPIILNQRDAIVKITSTAICGSDLHLYNGFIPTMQKGDILGHEFMGEVVELGREVHNLKVGDRVVVPFPIACGNCFFC